MKKNPTGNNNLQQPQPDMKWQTGSYSIHAVFEFTLPYQFLLLCKLMDVTPEKLVRDFTINLACECWQKENNYQAREHLINYFIAQGYGQPHYSEADIRQMFKELEALGLVFPHQGKSKLLVLFSRWREKHYTYWFKQWLGKKL